MGYALITGASRGIGRALAEALAKRKVNLLLVARSGDELVTLAQQLNKDFGVEAHSLVADLSLPEAPADIARWVNEQGYPLQILINNAGYGLWGRFSALALADQLNMMQLNLNALVALSHLLLPNLKAYAKEKKKAYLMNVASTAAYQAVPALSVYAATKAFVLLFSRGLRAELKETGVSVSCLSPGATTTSFVKRAKMSDKLRQTADKVSMTADKVAEIAVNGLFAEDAEIIPGGINVLTAVAASFIPKGLTEKIAAGLYLKDAGPEA